MTAAAQEIVRPSAHLAHLSFIPRTVRVCTAGEVIFFLKG